MAEKKLLIVHSETQVIYCKTLNQCLSACQLFELPSDDDYSLWSFDCEWKVDYLPGKTNPIALIQYCRHNVVILFHISAYGLPKKLVDILLNPRIIKVGVNINGDLQKLIRDFPTQFCQGIPSGCDLRRLSEVSGVPSSKSLAGMIYSELGLELPKPPETRCSNWENYPLTREQIYYAALDVIAGYLLSQKIVERWKIRRSVPSVFSSESLPFQLTPNQTNLPIAVDGKISDKLYIMISKNSLFFPHPREVDPSDASLETTNCTTTADNSDSKPKRLKTSTISSTPSSPLSLPPAPFESLVFPLPMPLLEYLTTLFSDFAVASELPTPPTPVPQFLSSKFHCYSLWRSGHTITQIMKLKSIKLSTVYSYLLDSIDIPHDQLLSPHPVLIAPSSLTQNKTCLEYSLSHFEITKEMFSSILSVYLEFIRQLATATKDSTSRPLVGEPPHPNQQQQSNVHDKENPLSASSLMKIRSGRSVPYKEIKEIYASHMVTLPPDWMIRLVSIHCRRKIANDWIGRVTSDEWVEQQQASCLV
jgi:hypothetical protein